MGIIAASCTGKIFGTAYWTPAGILQAILDENKDSKTKFAVFLGKIFLDPGTRPN